MTYLGRIRNGVVVFDPPAILTDGTVVRVEVAGRIAEDACITPEARAQKLRALFDQWNREDASLTEEQETAFLKALEANRGLQLHNNLEEILR